MVQESRERTACFRLVGLGKLPEAVGAQSYHRVSTGKDSGSFLGLRDNVRCESQRVCLGARLTIWNGWRKGNMKNGSQG